MDDFSSAYGRKYGPPDQPIGIFLEGAKYVYSYGIPYWEDVKDSGNYEEDDYPWGTICDMELRTCNSPVEGVYWGDLQSGLEYNLDLGYFVVVEMGSDDTNICKVE